MLNILPRECLYIINGRQMLAPWCLMHFVSITRAGVVLLVFQQLTGDVSELVRTQSRPLTSCICSLVQASVWQPVSVQVSATTYFTHVWQILGIWSMHPPSGKGIAIFVGSWMCLRAEKIREHPSFHVQVCSKLLLCGVLIFLYHFDFWLVI